MNKKRIKHAALCGFLNGYSVSHITDEIYTGLRKTGLDVEWKYVAVMVFDIFKALVCKYKDVSASISLVMSHYLALTVNIDNVVATVAIITHCPEESILYAVKLAVDSELNDSMPDNILTA